jgi:hypothetical protein
VKKNPNPKTKSVGTKGVSKLLILSPSGVVSARVK